MRAPILALASLLAATGCAAPPPPAPPALEDAPPSRPGPAARPRDRLAAALAVMAAHDAAGDWTDEVCAAVAGTIRAAGRGREAVAGYDAAIAWLRCDRAAEAIAVLREALMADERSPALLAALARAHLAGARHDRDAAGRLELARTVATRALAFDPGHAPAQLALGLIDAELRAYPAAAAAIDRARALDPGFFEAHLAAATLRFRLRDLAAAEVACRAALRLRPDHYEARLLLARVLRLRIDEADDAGWEARLAAATEAIEAALALRPERPEAYLSAAHLAVGYAARGPGGGLVALDHGRRLFEAFVARAGASPALQREVREARAWIEDLRDATECRFHESAEARKLRQQELHRKAAEDEAMRGGPAP
jgi:tetratricopeptide (TPR) repeat protein